MKQDIDQDMATYEIVELVVTGDRRDSHDGVFMNFFRRIIRSIQEASCLETGDTVH